MTTINEKFYRELRCEQCRKLIAYEYLYAGRLMLVCPRCKKENIIIFKHTGTKENVDIINQEFSLSNIIKEENKPKKGGEKINGRHNQS